MAKKLQKLYHIWMEKAEQSEGREKIVAQMVAKELCRNGKFSEGSGALYLLKKHRNYNHFVMPAFEPHSYVRDNCYDPRLNPIRDNLSKLTIEANALIDQIHQEHQEDVDAANAELRKIAESFGTRAKLDRSGEYYVIHPKRKSTSKSKSTKRSKKVE